MKNKTKFVLGSFALLLSPGVVLAADLTSSNATPQDVINLMKTIITYMYSAFYILAVAFILLAAFNYLQGGTNPEKIKIGKAQLKYAVIAIAIALCASGVSAILSAVLSGH